MARVYFRYSKAVLAELAAKYGEPTLKLVQRLLAREVAGEKISWPREEAPKNGTWCLDYRDAAGERTYEATIATTKGEAEAKLRSKRQEADDIKSGRAPRAGRPLRVRDAAAAVLKLKTGKPAHVADEQYFRLHVLPAFGHKFLAEVTAADVDEWTGKMAAEGYAPGSIQQALFRLGYCYGWARKARVFVGISPLEDSERIIIPKRLPKAFTEPQLDAFLRVAGRWTLLFFVAGILGPRKGELCGLQWEDFVEEHEFPDGAVGPVLHIRRSYARPYPKGRVERVLPVPEDIAEMLRAARREATSPWMFPSSTGGMRSKTFNAHKLFRKCCVRAGIVRGWRVSCKCGRFAADLPEKRHANCPECGTALLPRGIPPEMTFRHLRSTAATRLGDIRQAQALLGHADLATTARHYHAQELQVIRDTLAMKAAARVARFQGRDKGGTPPPPPPAASPKKLRKSL